MYYLCINIIKLERVYVPENVKQNKNMTTMAT